MLDDLPQYVLAARVGGEPNWACHSDTNSERPICATARTFSVIPNESAILLRSSRG
jgi:hypothetical protein